MAQKKKKSERAFDERKREFLLMFSREAPALREAIVNDLPAYNMLLDLRADTFEKIALRQVSEQSGMTENKDRAVVLNCPFCGGGHVGRKETKIYRCYDCRKTFSANHNSISSGTKCDALIWMKVLVCLLQFSSIAKTCDYCGISEMTYYKIRNRLFYGMQLLMGDLRLYGEIQADNTFVGVSYKGVDLRETEFPEESIFFDPTFKPREARKRGGPFASQERNMNSVCIFSAIDDRGHVLVRFAGIGAASYSVLKHYVPPECYLLSVPEKDPFSNLIKKIDRVPSTKPGDTTIILADKEGAIKKYAESLGVKYNGAVYRKNGVQLRKPDGAYNIQRVNALHRRLKTFLQKTGYVSTKYLPGYLTLFEFIENTGASQSAIKRLFEILATPNLGKSATFYQEMFSVPNYLEEWLNSDHPLSKLPYNKILAFYMYDQIRHKKEYPQSDMTMKEIEQETGYTAPTIRKLYRELNSANYREMILERFQGPKEKAKGSRTSTATLNPTVLAIYDAWAEKRASERKRRPNFSVFLKEQNKRYGTDYKRTNMLAKFKYIEEKGVRLALPPYVAPSGQPSVRKLSQTGKQVVKEYREIIQSYRERGESPPLAIHIQDMLGKKYGVKPNTVAWYLTLPEE